MNRRDHVLNAALLAVGLGFIVEPAGDVATFRLVAAYSLPLVLGALFPDIDVVFGSHRKTFHNLPVLGVFYAWPWFFGNLRYVWIGVATHYVLDFMGTHRGLALFYPWGREFDLPIGVDVSSRYAPIVMLFVTAFELALIDAILSGSIPVHSLTRVARTVLGSP